MTRLGVNIDHVATIREARKIDQPDPVAAAILTEQANADGIVCHLREDRRHIKDRDLFLLKEVVKTHLNLEMAAIPTMVKIACKVLPDMVTLVPERREEITTEGGLDVIGNIEDIREATDRLRVNNIVVSYFIDPDLNQIKAAVKAGADYVELHTGRYANSENTEDSRAECEKINSMSAAASKLGLGVSAGHGLNYSNVREIARIPHIEELNIGHSIVGRAVFVGLEQAVRDMLELIRFA